MASLTKLGRILPLHLSRTETIKQFALSSGNIVFGKQLHSKPRPFHKPKASFPLPLLEITSQPLAAQKPSHTLPLQEHICASNANLPCFILPSYNIVYRKEYVLPNITQQIALRLSLPALANQEKLDPLYQNWKIEEPTNKPVIEKHAVRMIIIRRKKMRKHQLRKLRKKMKIINARLRLKREIKKEKVFQAELMAQIKEAEAFNAEEYVKGILKKIKEAPRPETREERRERILDLMRKHRSHVNWIKPKFD